MAQRPQRLGERLGSQPDPGVAGEIRQGLERARRLGISLLEMEGRLHSTPVPELSLPRSFAEVLELAVSEARAGGAEAHAEVLLRQYVDSLPLALVLQQHTTVWPNAWLFHAPVGWAAMPRFCSGLEGLYRLFDTCQLDAAALFGAATPSEWTRRFESLGACYEATYFGRSFPMFAANSATLATLGAELQGIEGEADRWACVDHWLGAALLHEVLHFGRDRQALFPPYLDEAVAGYLGVRLLRETAFPAPGAENALDGFPWFAQVGQALVRAFGLRPVSSAHTGLRPWGDVLGPTLLDAIERLGWTAYVAHRPLHFHPDTTRPDRWAKLFYAAAAGREVAGLTFDDLDGLRMCDLALPDENDALEREMLDDALAAMRLEKVWRDPVWRVRSAAPAGPIALDFERGVATAPPRPGSSDPAALYVLPPNLCAARVRSGQLRGRA